ncbi:MAG: sugar ABC transporter ATP-binding protein [Gemmatimonadetes bacterium]|nr:MAG: sugar ABC transporter ATP-binding protein [Gemmatimonadota bacterium]
MAAEPDVAWLECAELTKAYGGVVALEGVSFRIGAGEIRGLIGANGAGKSTFVKILTGIAVPSAGSIRVDGSPLRLGSPKASLAAGIAAVPQELMVAPTMTVAENVMMGHYPQRGAGFLRRRDVRRRTGEILERLSVPVRPDDVVGELPLIQQRLVMVARAFSFEARLMIFDEPTATISPREVDVLLQAIGVLSARGVSILYVSHRLDEIDSICTSVTVLRDGRVAAELTAAEATHSALVEQLTVGDAARDRRPAAAPLRPAAGEPLLELDGVGGAWLDDITLSVGRGEIVGVAGLSGSGAREILLTVAGALPYSKGKMTLGGKPARSGNVPRAVSAGTAFLPGDRSLGAFAGQSIRFNVSLPTIAAFAKASFIHRKAERSAVASLLERVALRRDPEAAISSLSGGNQQKAIVARWLGARSQLLLLDDPTAGVDVRTRPELHQQIRQACADGAGVLLVSSDIDELVELAHRVVVVAWRRIVGELSGPELTTPKVLAAMTRQEEDVPA